MSNNPIHDALRKLSIVDTIPAADIEKLPGMGKELAQRLKEVAPRGSPAYEFLQTVAQANGVRLATVIRGLPADVIQSMLEGRATSMEEFFRSWAESIARNAQADKQASERSQQQKEANKRPRKGCSLFAASLSRACNLGKISAGAADEVRTTAGIAKVEPREAAQKTKPIFNPWTPMPPDKA